uniref:Uncharacterized protein n=1 Tax=Aegilops tauschii subsp. strangulata TaxID=200361 RepID=A0A453BY97_AEGTS
CIGNLVNLVTIPPLGSVFSVPSICQMGISSQVLWTKAFEDQCLNYISLRYSGGHGYYFTILALIKIRSVDI